MMEKLRRSRFFLRLLVLTAGLFCIAFGVALSTKSGLGVSPSASLPFLLSKIFPLSMGTFTTLINVVFVFVQIALLRRDYKPVQLLQLAVVFLFGFFTDFTISLVQPLTVTAYPLQLALSAVSCAVMGFGVYLEVKAGLLMMASEGAIGAIAKVLGTEFGKIKIAMDCGFVVVSTIVSFVAFHKLLGVREGTIIAAVLVGLFVQLYNRRLHFLEPLLESAPAAATGAETAAAGAQTPLVITIERELGSGGHELGERLAAQLGLPFYDYALLTKTAEATGLPAETVEKSEERLDNRLTFNLYQTAYATTQQISRQDEIFRAQSGIVRELADAGSCVIVGRLAAYVLKGRENCFHIFVSGSEEFRAERVGASHGISAQEALALVRREDANRHNYCTHFTGQPWGAARHYALALDSSQYGVDGALRLVQEALAQRKAAAPDASQ